MRQNRIDLFGDSLKNASCFPQGRCSFNIGVLELNFFMIMFDKIFSDYIQIDRYKKLFTVSSGYVLRIFIHKINTFHDDVILVLFFFVESRALKRIYLKIIWHKSTNLISIKVRTKDFFR